MKINNHYIAKILETSPLSREHEQILFKRAKSGDRRARDIFLTSNLRFVFQVARKYGNNSIPVEDLVNEGMLGLHRAFSDYDPKTNYKFISYAVWWIRAYIFRHIEEHARTVRVPSYKSRLTRKKKPNEEDNVDDISVFSLDTPLASGKQFIKDLLADPKGDDSEQFIQKSSVKKIIQELLKELQEREIKVLLGLFGFSHEVPRTQQDIASEMNISGERVRQIKSQAILRLRDVLKEHPDKNSIEKVLQN